MQLFRQTLLVSLLMIFLLLVACSDRQQPTEARGDSVDDLDSLVNRLQGTGATVEPAGTVSQPFFTPRGQVIVVNGQDVQAFEYESQADANAEVALVAPDGSSVGASIMSWMATPHFFNGGKLTVLYVGDQNDTIDVLEALLGTQFAGG